MRISLSLFLFIFFVSAKAQTPFTPDILYAPVSLFTPFHSFGHSGDLNNDLNKKWSFSKYAGLTTGFSFFGGGSATVVSAPVGLQLNRRLNNNLYAFGGVSVAPSYINFNRSFISPGFNKYNPGSNLSSANNFGIYSRAEMGLMYINDQRTFSISGSIGIERSSYPFYQPQRIRQQHPASHTW